jgi:hypothetical protein
MPDAMRTSRRSVRRRRGIALADAIIGGIILGIGMTVLFSLAGRSMAQQTDGEKRIVAAWLADEILNMVIVEGPDQYPVLYDTQGEYDGAFEGYSFDIDIEELGKGAPYKVEATIRWGPRERDQLTIETLVALRMERPDEPVEPTREPFEPIDRDARYFEEEGMDDATSG